MVLLLEYFEFEGQFPTLKSGEVLVGSNIDCPDPTKDRGMDQVKNRFKAIAIVIMPTLQVINSVDSKNRSG